MLNELLTRYPELKTCEKDVVSTENAIIETYKNNGKHKMLVCSGNPNDCFDWSSFNDNVEIKN